MINSSITSKKDIVSNPGYIIQHPWLKVMLTVPQINKYRHVLR